ncbi:MAG: glycosyltransferase [Nitrospiraceae bacterium]|nr:glycosyltransferase [Nitrospiraceae bacterium]
MANERGSSDPTAPRVTVIVPVYNGADTIGECLESLLRQSEQGPACEILVVDDASRDSTPTVVARYPLVRAIRQEVNAGPAAARNRGAREATGDIILFTDADCVPGEGWLREMLRSFGDPLVMGVKGVYRTKQRELTARVIQLEFEYKYRKLAAQSAIDFIDTYSAGYRRAVFLEFGGFDTAFPVPSTEDIDLSFRVAAKGHLLVFNPSAYVFHRHPAGVADYLKRKFRYAYWGMLVVRRFPEKAIRNSYTPHSQRLQVLLAPLAIASLGIPVLAGTLLWIPIALWTMLMATLLPFMARSAAKDPVATLASPAYLIAKAVVQACAGAMAALSSTVMSKNNAPTQA